MGKKLAIKGHSTRGKEVIELMEMIGGNNRWGASGVLPNLYYFISNECIIYSSQIEKDVVIFTLEEFLEKYPFKVGDKVHIYVQNDDIDGRCDIETAEITSMRWNHARCKIAYKMKDINREFYKEEIKCKVVDSNKSTRVMEEKDKAKAPNLKGEDYSGKRFGYKIPDGYEFDVVVDGKIILKPIKPKYPITYEECREILEEQADVTYGYNRDILHNLQVLLVCRDTYWKITGKEMGLNGPWEPDWNELNPKYTITFIEDKLVKHLALTQNYILAFPTEEIRDTFYENFKDLIEQCKELL